MNYQVPAKVLQSSDWQRRLYNAKDCAEKGKEGDVFFLQVSKTPLVSLFITTGSLVDPVTGLRKVDLHYVSQHSLYPIRLCSNEENDTRGYAYYQKSLLNDRRNTCHSLDYDDYKIRFEATCVEIDKSIHTYHGVRCYRDGNPHNNEKNNYYILHVCDIMNILIHAEVGKVPDLKLKTALLQTLPPDKQHKTIEEHTDCDCDYSKKLDLQDPNKTNQRSKQELPALEKPDVIFKIVKDTQTRLSNVLSRHNKPNKPEDHNPPFMITVIEEEEEKNTPELPRRPTALNLHTPHDTLFETLSTNSDSNPSHTSANTTRIYSQGLLYNAINEEHSSDHTYPEDCCCLCLSKKKLASIYEQPCLPCPRYKQPKWNCLTIHLVLTTTVVSIASLIYTANILLPLIIPLIRPIILWFYWL